MTLRLQRTLLRLSVVAIGAIALTLGWLAVCAYAAQEAPSAPTTPLTDPDGQAGPPVASQRVDPKSEAWSRPLQRPLFDPPPPPPKVVKKELPPIRAKLLGTILEPGASRAMIQLPGNKVEFRGVGEPLGPQDPEAVIEEIGPQTIRVARGDENTELTIERGY